MTLEEIRGAPEFGGNRLWLVGCYTKQWQKEGTDVNMTKQQITKWDGLPWREGSRKKGEDAQMCSFGDLTDRFMRKDLDFHFIKIKGPGAEACRQNCIEGVGEENSQSHQTAFSAQP